MSELEDLDEGLVRDPELLETRAEPHLAATGVYLDRQLGRDAALPHPRLTRDDGNEQLSLPGATPQLAKLAANLRPADKRRGVGEELERRRQVLSCAAERFAPPVATERLASRAARTF